MIPTRTTAAAAAVLLSAASACSSAATPQGDTCTALFGQPAAKTGLTSAQCQPSCACAGVSFTPPTYSAAFVAAICSTRLGNSTIQPRLANSSANIWAVSHA